MKAEQIKKGNKVQLSTGSTAEIVEILPNKVEVRIRYVDAPFEPELEGKVGVCTIDDITGHYEGDLTKTAGQLG